ncbi:MAG TPA: hypothetical protein VFI32_00640 [Rhodanobacteraceae bacterium]|jgi:hypothetical protein|nr:hypothetical protein [Rhodanobacteraceae bacterium]
MQKALLFTAILSATLAASGCKQNVAEPAADAKPASGAPALEAKDAASAKKLPKFASPERIAEIKASGKTGFWSDPVDYCPRHRVAVLTWNVEASGAKKVVLFVVGKNGKERNFGRGGPIGERQTGAWLKPGSTFRLRNPDGNAELGTITFKRGTSC